MQNKSFEFFFPPNEENCAIKCLVAVYKSTEIRRECGNTCWVSCESKIKNFIKKIYLSTVWTGLFHKHRRI